MEVPNNRSNKFRKRGMNLTQFLCEYLGTLHTYSTYIYLGKIEDIYVFKYNVFLGFLTPSRANHLSNKEPKL